MGTGDIAGGSLALGSGLVRDASSDSATLVAWRQRIGFAFREKGLISNLTLFDNVDLPAKYHGRYRAGIARGALAEKALTELEVDPAVWHVRPSRINWEIRKKILLARAIVLDPEVLILDDPSALMSSPSLPGLVSWVHRQLDKGTGILLGTNDYPVGLALADWILHPISNRTVTSYDDFVDQPWLEAARLLASQAPRQPHQPAKGAS
jgi:ABC-type transporter Mla maintaining outer membrane lipid asymmetry ATPase subunit MlaF